MQNIKILALTAFIGVIAGFIIGYSVSSSDTVKKGERAIRYMSYDRLKLPEFNQPTLQPTGQLIFLRSKAAPDTVYQSICDDHSHIQIPASYPLDILLTERDPISQSGNQIQFQYYDPRLKSEVINTYDLRPSPWKWGLRLDAFTPVYTIDPVIGPRIELGHENVLLNVGAYLHPSTQKVHAVGGLSIKLTGS